MLLYKPFLHHSNTIQSEVCKLYICTCIYRSKSLMQRHIQVCMCICIYTLCTPLPVYVIA